jgi:ATP-dependent DNA ligase
MLPQISPSPLTSVKEPIGHPNWVYELKHDGFRGILYVDRAVLRFGTRSSVWDSGNS